MSHDAADQGRFLHTTPTLMLAVCALATGGASVLHWLEPNTDPLNLWLPALLAAGFSLLSLLSWRIPDRPLLWVFCGICNGVLAMAIPAWYFTLRAWAPGGTPLVQSLPPVAAGLLPLVLVIILFSPQQRLQTALVLAWLAVASPVVVYLLAHPAELLTPRGLDLIILMGPAMAILVAYVPFHRGMVTRLEQLREERANAEFLAERDTLTGLKNRRVAEAALNLAVSKADETAALILFDVDHFKRVNDEHGHPAGDGVLREVTKRCGQRLRKSDLFCRWGGEEFLVLVLNASEHDALRLSEEMRAAIAASSPAPVGRVTASFGLALYRRGDSVQAWLDRADKALYAAKSNGRDRIHSA
jgi:diguanylate cyclase (GGDEF)-like protein